MEDINWSQLNLDKKEAAARGTQIKRLLGVKDGEPITAEQLKDCVAHTNQDSSLLTFLNAITDFDGAAEWLNKNAYSFTAAINLLDYDFLKKTRDWRGCQTT